MKRLTNDEFIKRAKKIHGDKYDYSHVNYINNYTKVEIICPKHGKFYQLPPCHSNGQSCKKCRSENVKSWTLLTTESFIKRAKLKHGNKYDYSEVNYIGCRIRIKIICNTCKNIFFQKPNDHLNGCGCPPCGIKKRNKTNSKTTEMFLERAYKKHKNKYDYSKVNYINSKTKITIICSEHGEFKQSVRHHLNGIGCPECSMTARSDKQRKKLEIFIDQAKIKHNNKYDYSLVKYKNNCTKIEIICPSHGSFWQIPKSHLKGRGCKKCMGEKLSKTKIKSINKFINDSIEIHGGKYDYSKVNYNGSNNKIKIICPLHGVFEKKPCRHLMGEGCPKCVKNVSKPESKFLDYLKISQENRQKRISTFSIDGLKNNKVFEFLGDFYHGNPRVFNLKDTNKKVKCTFEELYNKTVKKFKRLASMNYKVYYIWENDWNLWEKKKIKTLPIKIFNINNPII